jgi:hypothetical protein
LLPGAKMKSIADRTCERVPSQFTAKRYGSAAI